MTSLDIIPTILPQQLVWTSIGSPLFPLNAFHGHVMVDIEHFHGLVQHAFFHLLGFGATLGKTTDWNTDGVSLYGRPLVDS